MARKIDSKILRIIDANFNRLKEGLRVCEDITRFILNDRYLSKNYKDIRHKTSNILTKFFLNLNEIIQTRDIIRDVGKKTIKLEVKRDNFVDIFVANIQRVKESIRVIEEFNKLFDRQLAEKFKTIRYKIYELEKKTIKRLETLCSTR